MVRLPNPLKLGTRDCPLSICRSHKPQPIPLLRDQRHASRRIPLPAAHVAVSNWFSSVRHAVAVMA